ncbi:MAG: PSD1 and planctomycete cytochrome C domain-containing protein [Fuerstiella sp.]
MPNLPSTISYVFILLCAITECLGDQPVLSSDDLQFFETKIRPVLVAHCYQCHSQKAQDIGGRLLLDSRAAVLKGGESGPAIVAGDPDASPLIQALHYDGLEMPPEKPLPENVVNDFVAWVKRGAPDPRTGAPTASASEHSDPEALWAFRPPQAVSVPKVKNAAWPQDPIDNFVLSKIEAAGLHPTDDAGSRTLVRRLYFDLTGLPPTFRQTQQFITAHSNNGYMAVEQLVDELLASPQFGERWGRHWLDVARYGESNGNDGLGRNPTFPHAWRYRDYVIAAFNADVPYDRFLTEQIAGDLLPAETDEQRDRQLVATGFLALTAKPAKAMNTNFAMDVVADQIDVIGRGVMGISVACARCHDHKFDPIPTRDYYALAGIFTSTETLWGTAAHEGLTAPKTDLHVLKSAAHVPPPADFVETVLVLESNTGKPKPVPASRWPAGTPLAMGVRDAGKPADCKVNIKGDAKKLGEAVPRGFLSACRLDSDDLPAIDPAGSGRLELAQWLTRSDHPLTARVMVNRLWQHLFGTGIVRTPDDFGVYGARPSHPKLLDYLALRLIDERWSLKRMIRSIVLSRTYQLSSEADDALRNADPANALLTRHLRRRLDAEALRDSMLKVSGQLDTAPAEGSIIRHRDILVNLAGNLHQPSNHRSVYLCYLRSSPPPELAPFDLPEFTSVLGQRDVSTVPNQALHLYNSPFVIEQAEHLAAAVTKKTADDDGRLQLMWQRAFGRPISSEETTNAMKFLRTTRQEISSEEQTWASLAQALLITSEFRYVD